MIKVAELGAMAEQVHRVIHSLNFSPEIREIAVVGSEETIPVAPAKVFGGVAVDREVFRTLQPDARWLVHAAGWAKGDATHTATIGLQYESDTPGTVVVLGTVVIAASATYSKFRLGPFDVFGTGGVPAGENVPIVTLTGVVAAGGAGTIRSAAIWLRLLAAQQ